MSDYTTPEDLLDGINEIDLDDQFLPDDGKYKVKIHTSLIDAARPYQNERGSGVVGAKHRFGLQILEGPTQQNNRNCVGRVFFGAEVPIPGGDYFNPKFELYGDFTDIKQVIEAAKAKLARFLNTFGWSIEQHGRAFRTDPNVFVGLETVEGANVSTKKYIDKQGVERVRVYFNPPKK